MNRCAIDHIRLFAYNCVRGDKLMHKQCREIINFEDTKARREILESEDDPPRFSRGDHLKLGRYRKGRKENDIQFH